jgi:hypothetical protein
MPELMLVNPRRKRRHRRGMSSLQRKYFGKRRRSHRRRSAVTVMNTNPRRVRRRRRRTRVTRFRRNPTSLGSMMRRRNTVQGFMDGVLIPSAVGALGGVLLDTALAYLPIPTSLMTPTLEPFVRIGGAALLGMLAENVSGSKIGNEVALGAVTVTLYELASSWFAGMGGYTAATATPTTGTVGYYSPAYQMAYYSR